METREIMVSVTHQMNQLTKKVVKDNEKKGAAIYMLERANN